MLKDLLVGFFYVLAFSILMTVFVAVFVLLTFYSLGIVESFVAIFVSTSCYYFRIIAGVVSLFIFFFLYSFIAYVAKERPFKNW